MLVATATSTKTLWYATRGTGVVALLLLTGSVVLGTLSSARWRTARMPRFLVGGLHRNLTLLAVAFVAAHIVTAVADRFAPIGYKDGLLPFLSPYRPIWLGLGTVAFDLLLALVVTSLLRAWLGFRVWRVLHWLAYAAWPVALLHALGTGSDARLTWMAFIGFASCALVVIALILRLVRGTMAMRVRIPASAAALLVPLALFVWYLSGPAQRGWAARAGTPTALLRPRAAAPTPAMPVVQRSLPPESFDGQLAGSLRQTGPEANGLVKVDIRATVDGSVRGKLRITLWGEPSGSGIALAASDVAFGAAGTTQPYVGQVVGLDGNTVDARLSDAAGSRVELSVDLNLHGGNGVVTGLLRGRAT
jgi:Ferric reductase like transmembrane component